MKNRNTRILILLTTIVCFLTACKNDVKSGTEYLEQGKNLEAVSAFEQAVEEAEKKKEDASEAYRGLGMAYYAQEDYESARTNLQKALEEGALQTPAIYNLIGVCSMNLEDYDSALTAFEQGIELPSGGVVSKGTKLEQTVDYSEVIQEMKWNRVVCYEKKPDWASAKAAMSEYSMEYPNDVEAQKEAEFLSTR